MKTKLPLLAFALLLAGTSAFASTVNVKVNGMVCSFCAQGIEKKFLENSAVSKIAVSLTDKRVTITEKDGAKIDDTVIKKTLEEAGYTVENIERKN